VEDGVDAAPRIELCPAQAIDVVKLAGPVVAREELTRLLVDAIGETGEVGRRHLLETLGVELGEVFLELDEAGGDEAVEDLAGLEGARAEADGDLLDGPALVDLADQRPLLG